MRTGDTAPLLAHLFDELVNGDTTGGGYMLNTGDIGLIRSLGALSADEASQSANDGASIAAHAQHLRYGLELMNQWAARSGNPFANAKWDEAWKIARVDAAEWSDIRAGLDHEARRWLDVLKTPREVNAVEWSGLVASIGHLAYHLGAIRQIGRSTRGPKEGTFTP
jgi:hypothetical protein